MGYYTSKKYYVLTGQCIWRAVKAIQRSEENGQGTADKATAEAVGNLALNMMWAEIVPDETKEMFGNDKEQFLLAVGAASRKAVAKVIKDPVKKGKMAAVYLVGAVVQGKSGKFKKTGTVRITEDGDSFLAVYSPKVYGLPKKQHAGTAPEIRNWIASKLLWTFNAPSQAQLIKERLKAGRGLGCFASERRT